MLDLQRTRKPQTTRAVSLRPATPAPIAQALPPMARVQRALIDPGRASPGDILALQQSLGNGAVQRLLSQPPPIQRKPQIEDEEALRRQGDPGRLSSATLEADTESEIQRARGGGQPLPDPVRAPMEQSFGADFSGVRVHADVQADRLNRQISAKAFTLGSDIFFRQGAYNPGSSGGRELLAHELTHVVQQGRSGSTIQGKLSVGPAEDRHEREAAALSQLVGRRVSFDVGAARRAGVQRQNGQGNTLPNTIQRYGEKTKLYTKQPSDAENAPAMFETQSVDPVITDENKLRHEFKQPDQPSLLFSDDGTIAIQATDTQTEAKEFYATNDVVEAANEKLLGVKSAVALSTASGNKITAKGKTLEMVLPSLRQTGDVGRALELATNICIEVAMLVMGKLGQEYKKYETEAVFQSAERGSETPPHTKKFTPTGSAPKEIYNLADYIAKLTGDPDVEKMSKALTEKREGELVGQVGTDYGKKSSKGKLKRQEMLLGINKFARPEVGEGMASFSTAKAKKGASWGYHYAGVVAKSLDGADYVTLENYNRSGDINKLRAKLYWKLMDENKQVIAQRLREMEEKAENDLFAKSALTKLSKETVLPQVATKAKDLIVTLKKMEGKSKEEANKAYKDVVNTEPNRRWFFKMYGSGKGQSFHEQSAKSGFFTDPITLRVRKPQSE